jgi:hypothetical protein
MRPGALVAGPDIRARAKARTEPCAYGSRGAAPSRFSGGTMAWTLVGGAALPGLASGEVAACGMPCRTFAPAPLGQLAKEYGINVMRHLPQRKPRLFCRMRQSSHLTASHGSPGELCVQRAQPAGAGTRSHVHEEPGHCVTGVLAALPPGLLPAEAPRLRLPGGHVWTSLPCSSSLQAASRSHRTRAEGASGPCRSDAHIDQTTVEDPQQSRNQLCALRPMVLTGPCHGAGWCARARRAWKSKMQRRERRRPDARGGEKRRRDARGGQRRDMLGAWGHAARLLGGLLLSGDAQRARAQVPGRVAGEGLRGRRPGRVLRLVRATRPPHGRHALEARAHADLQHLRARAAAVGAHTRKMHVPAQHLCGNHRHVSATTRAPCC